jgi:hypothetical protein
MVIREEQALLYCDHQKLVQLSLRAKGEVIKLISERLRGRNTVMFSVWLLRKLIPH